MSLRDMSGVEAFVASGPSLTAAAPLASLLFALLLLLAISACQEVSGEGHPSIPETERVSRHQAKEPEDQAKEPGDQSKEPGEKDQAKEPGKGKQARRPGQKKKTQESGKKREYSKETRTTAEPVKVKDPPLAGGEKVEDKRTLLYGRIFGEPEQAMPVIEQMIFENATAECHAAIVPRRNKGLQDWLRACCGLGGLLNKAGLAAALLQGQGLDRPPPWPGSGAVCVYSTGEYNPIWVPMLLVQIVKNEARLQDDDPESPDTDVRFGDKYNTMGHS